MFTINLQIKKFKLTPKPYFTYNDKALLTFKFLNFILL